MVGFAFFSFFFLPLSVLGIWYLHRRFLWVICFFSFFSLPPRISSSSTTLRILSLHTLLCLNHSKSASLLLSFTSCLSTGGPVVSGFGTYPQCPLVRTFLFIFIHCIDHHHLFNKAILPLSYLNARIGFLYNIRIGTSTNYNNKKANQDTESLLVLKHMVNKIPELI